MDDFEKDLWIDVYVATVSDPILKNMTTDRIAEEATTAVLQFRKACLLDVT